MKTVVAAILCAFMCSDAFAQVPCESASIGYVACVVHEDIWWQNQNEWGAWHVADLYLDGVLQEPSNDYYYRWYRQNDGIGNYDLQLQGYGEYRFFQDNEANQFHRVFVSITLPTNQVITSDTIITAKYGDPELAWLFARKEDGTSFVDSSLETIGRWSGYKWGSASSGIWVPPGINLPMQSEDLVKIKPNVAELGEKFHRGITLQNDIVWENYSSYPIYLGQRNEFTFHHRSFTGATIRAELLDAATASGATIEFKDPWFEDAFGLGGEYYSRGMDAPYIPYSSPLSISTGPPRYGVFLNQGYPRWDPPYYSVGAPNPNTIGGYPAYFQNWTGTNVTYRSANKDTSAIVFTGSNATATTLFCAFSSLFS